MAMKRNRKTRQPPDPPYIYQTVREAYRRLAFRTTGALHKHLRRHERNGRVELGQGAIAERIGPRCWRIRFSLEPGQTAPDD